MMSTGETTEPGLTAKSHHKACWETPTKNTRTCKTCDPRPRELSVRKNASDFEVKTCGVRNSWQSLNLKNAIIIRSVVSFTFSLINKFIHFFIHSHLVTHSSNNQWMNPCINSSLNSFNDSCVLRQTLNSQGSQVRWREGEGEGLGPNPAAIRWGWGDTLDSCPVHHRVTFTPVVLLWGSPRWLGLCLKPLIQKLPLRSDLENCWLDRLCPHVHQVRVTKGLLDPSAKSYRNWFSLWTLALERKWTRRESSCGFHGDTTVQQLPVTQVQTGNTQQVCF